MIRIDAGGHVHTSSSGVVVHVDRPLSVEQVDVLVAAIERAGESPDFVRSIEMSEAGVFLECFALDEAGRPMVDSDAAGFVLSCKRVV